MMKRKLLISGAKYWGWQKVRNLSSDLYIRWIFFSEKYNCAKFRHYRLCIKYFTHWCGWPGGCGGAFCPHPWTALKRLIMNKVKHNFMYQTYFIQVVSEPFNESRTKSEKRKISDFNLTSILLIFLRNMVGEGGCNLDKTISKCSSYKNFT